MFKIIVCTNNNNAIGKNGKLLYHISEDLRNFKRMTIGQIVVMGRKTFESLPYGKALTDRINIVITSYVDKQCEKDGAIFVPSIDEAINVCKAVGEEKEWYVIGGGSIYSQFIERGLVDTIYQTQVIDNEEGDTFFPDVSKMEGFRLFYCSETQFNQPPYVFRIWKKNKAC